MKRFNRIIPHMTIILSAMFIVFWVLDILNPTMNFINRRLSNKLMIILLVSSMITAIANVYFERKLDALTGDDDDGEDEEKAEVKETEKA